MKRTAHIEWLLLSAGILLSGGCAGPSYDGLGTDMASLCRLSYAQTRSISPENFTGERGGGALADPAKDKGKRNVANASHSAQELGKGWKVNPAPHQDMLSYNPL